MRVRFKKFAPFPRQREPRVATIQVVSFPMSATPNMSTYYTQCHRCAPPSADHSDLLRAAVELAEAGKLEEALSSFDAAVQAAPQDGAAHEQRAQVLLELDRYPEAVLAAVHATATSPKWAIAWLTLGRAQLNAGAFGEAAAALQRSLDLDESLREEAIDDLDRARQLQQRSDEAELHMHTGATLRVQQWRGSDDGTASDSADCHSCASSGRQSGTPEGSEATSRHGTGTMVWECGIVLAKLLDHAAAGGVPAASPLHEAFACKEALRGSRAQSERSGDGDEAAASGDGDAAASGRTSQLLERMRVVELGSGTGIGGLAAAALGACVALTDVAELAPLLASNAAANAAVIAAGGGEANACALDWEGIGRGDDLPEAVAEGCDLVLASDALYHCDDGGAQLAALSKTIARLARPTAHSPRGARLLLVHKTRHDRLDEALRPALRGHASMELHEVSLEHHHPDYCSPFIHVYVGQVVAG